jgi:hypothetical protein
MRNPKDMSHVDRPNLGTLTRSSMPRLVVDTHAAIVKPGLVRRLSQCSNKGI